MNDSMNPMSFSGPELFTLRQAIFQNLYHHLLPKWHKFREQADPQEKADRDEWSCLFHEVNGQLTLLVKIEDKIYTSGATGWAKGQLELAQTTNAAWWKQMLEPSEEAQ